MRHQPSADRPWEGYLTRVNAQAAFDLIAKMLGGPRLHTVVTVIGDRPPEVRSGQRADNIYISVPDTGRAHMSWDDDRYHHFYETYLDDSSSLRGAKEHELTYIQFSEDQVRIRTRNGYDKTIHTTFSLEGR